MLCSSMVERSPVKGLVIGSSPIVAAKPRGYQAEERYIKQDGGGTHDGNLVVVEELYSFDFK